MLREAMEPSNFVLESFNAVFCLALVRSSFVKRPSFYLSSPKSLDLQFLTKDLVNIWSYQFDPHLDL